MNKKNKLLIPMSALFVLFSFFYFIGRGIVVSKEKEYIHSSMSSSSSKMSGKLYVLEIIGLGVAVNEYRQGVLWDMLKQGSAYQSIIDNDPNSYPWSGSEKMSIAGSREEGTLENAVLDTPRYWGIPAFNAAPRFQDKNFNDRPDRPQGGIVSGMWDMHILIIEHRELSDRPDRVFEKIFTFFDENPDVPFVVLGTADGDAVQADAELTSKFLPDGHYVPKIPDVSAVFVLARRERADSLRPFAFKDLEEPQVDVEFLNQHGIARRVWLNYLTLQKKVPMPQGVGQFLSPNGRQPTSQEWHSDLRIFYKNFDLGERGKSSFKFLDVIRRKPVFSNNWRPKEWFPVPWNLEQLASFDRLPTLGFLHRPVFVKMTDAQGRLLTDVQERELALQNGWHSASEMLPIESRSISPSRVIVATGGNASHLVEFHGMLRRIADDRGPKFNPSNLTQFIDVDCRLGNTGAATFFMQTAIGVLGSYREGGVSAAFNLRDPSESSIIFISPPSDELRNRQQHVLGGDVLKSAAVPAVDPKNYEEP